MSEDPIAQYLAQLRAGLRTPPERTGGVRAGAGARRRPAAAALAELGMAAMRLAAVYLLTVPAAGLFAFVLRQALIRVAAPPGTTVVVAPVGYGRTTVVLAVSALAGLVLLAGCRRAGQRRTRGTGRRSGREPAALLGGYFPLAAVISMFVLVLLLMPLLRALNVPGATLAAVPGMWVATTFGAAAVAIGYAVQMSWILLRQRDTGERVPHAG